MKRSIIAFLFVLLLFTDLQIKAQNHKAGERLFFGSSLTYIWNSDQATGYRWHETTWNLNTGISLSSRFWIGAQSMLIYTRNNRNRKENYKTLGLLTQYDMVVWEWRNSRVFAEISANRSDYYTGLGTERKIQGLFVGGIGAGYEFAIIEKSIYLEIGFYSYHIMNELKSTNPFTQYIIGLNYRFGKS